MATEKPVLVLVHGAFHPPHFYRKLIELLRQEGYVVLAPPMLTTGLDDSVIGKTYVDDVKRVHEYLLPYLDAGREAVLVCHSQGGIAGSAATEGQTTEERKARGLKGGINAIVYLAAFALPERGLSLMSAIGGHPPPFYAADAVQGPLYKVNENAADSFYNDLPDIQRKRLLEDLVYQSKASTDARAHFVAADVTAQKTYIVCTEDRAAPPAAQRAWAQMSNCSIVEIKSDHSPFLQDDKNRQVVDVILKIEEN
ncbi:hypothetical protein SCUP515_00609 [Seiridium cupressi]